MRWRRRPPQETDNVDVAARLDPYHELFDRAMATAARFAEERARRETDQPARRGRGRGRDVSAA